MTVYGRMLLAAAGSALLILGALGFQYFGGLPPCEMCIWQRWPHGLAAVLGVLGVTVLWRQRRVVSVAGALLMLAGAGIAFFHAGVEQGWWEGVTACSQPQDLSMSTKDLLAAIMANDQIVRCDEIPWSMLGLSLAGWNAVASLGLAALWICSAMWWQMPRAAGQASSSASQ